ncbi:MAG: glycosyltransferase family 2 protein [Cruoricaptor ignavus]|nr:glycosyltransferase family 2 protein [Cruoricaptor ignavus]
MTDILIKSFNRPFYLDRCIQSIKNFVQGIDKITVLDDGTPEKYLLKIKEKHPEIEIKTSDSYSNKIKAIEENLKSGTEINGFEIPTKLWKSAAKEASDYFIMTEDDVWFTQKINLDELSASAKNNKTELVKLGWLGNFNDDKDINIHNIDENISGIPPKKLFLHHPFIMDLFFYNKYKFFTIMYRLGLADNTTKRKYWALNSILMGFWEKNYWLYIWKDAKGKVDEKQQLKNAAVYYRNQKENRNFIARTKEEKMKTTFQSSATNSYHEYGFDFDVNLFNHLINEAWYNDEFDAMQNFPKDFSTDYFESFVSEKINVQEFRKWVEQFKNQYRNLGADVDS